MNRLPREQQVRILNALVEGNSMRSTARMAGVSFNTVVKLLLDAGRVCAEYQKETLRNLSCKRLQCDEIWSFVGMKQQNVPEEKRGQFGYGDVYTWTAICADTKLVPSWLVADRGLLAGRAFMEDLASRLKNRVQLTTDGHRAYLEAVEGAFGSEVDYAMLVKLYGKESEGERRYSPAECVGAQAVRIQGKPEPKAISTSYAERQNLTMRMGMRRFTRLTNGFSKKVENHAHAVSLYFMHYNFVRIHKTLRMTPAMAAGVATRPWEMAGILDLIEKRIYRSN